MLALALATVEKEVLARTGVVLGRAPGAKKHLARASFESDASSKEGSSTLTARQDNTIQGLHYSTTHTAIQT